MQSKNQDHAPSETMGGKGRTKNLSDANENIRKARADDATDTSRSNTDGVVRPSARVDSRKTGNRPAFDRDR